MAANLPESTDPLGNRTDVFLAYLDSFRERILDKVAALPRRNTMFA